MKIVLIEDQPNSTELTFQQEVVKIGRDSSECEIVFPREKYPMVSRLHAEIRHHDHTWILIDQKSTYGTYLNKQKVTSHQVIQVGSTIQIGAEGPSLIVIFLETGGVSMPIAKTPS